MKSGDILHIWRPLSKRGNVWRSAWKKEDIFDDVDADTIILEADEHDVWTKWL